MKLSMKGLLSCVPPWTVSFISLQDVQIWHSSSCSDIWGGSREEVIEAMVKISFTCPSRSFCFVLWSTVALINSTEAQCLARRVNKCDNTEIKKQSQSLSVILAWRFIIIYMAADFSGVCFSPSFLLTTILHCTSHAARCFLWNEIF